MQTARYSVEDILGLLCRQIGMDAAFISMLGDEGWVVRHAISASPGDPVSVEVGCVQDSWNSYCHLLAQSKIRRIIPDTSLDPAVADLLTTTTSRIGAYIGMPLTNADGTVFATVCAYAHDARPEVDDRDYGILEVMAEVLADFIVSQERHDIEARTVRQHVEGFRAGLGHDIHWQPVRQVDDLEVVGFEALSRFTVDGMPVPPESMFAQASRAGVGVPLEMHAFRSALAGVGDGTTSVAINLSSAAICSPEFEASALRSPSVEWSRVVVELTEHEDVDDYGQVRAILAPLRRQGLRVAVDDFGAGYASMRHVIELEADIIKVDKELVRDLHHFARRRDMVAGVMAFATLSGTVVIAEGVETSDELLALRDLKVPYAQGFLLGRPAGAQLAPAVSW